MDGFIPVLICLLLAFPCCFVISIVSSILASINPDKYPYTDEAVRIKYQHLNESDPRPIHAFTNHQAFEKFDDHNCLWLNALGPYWTSTVKHNFNDTKSGSFKTDRLQVKEYRDWDYEYVPGSGTITIRTAYLGAGITRSRVDTDEGHYRRTNFRDTGIQLLLLDVDNLPKDGLMFEIVPKIVFNNSAILKLAQESFISKYIESDGKTYYIQFHGVASEAQKTIDVCKWLKSHEYYKRNKA